MDGCVKKKGTDDEIGKIDSLEERNIFNPNWRAKKKPKVLLKGF